MKHYLKKRSEQGLTLVESLAAIMVITAVITAISPALLITYATRVHNYRVNQAQKLAQGEIDRVRLQVESGQYLQTVDEHIEKLPPSMGQAGAGEFDVYGVRAPDPAQNEGPCPRQDVGAGSSELRSWCTVDINGDGEDNWDLAVQTFRSSTPADVYSSFTGGGYPAFLMGVRVYTRTAMESGNLLDFPRNRTASAGLTSGQSLSLPIVSRYESIVRSDLGQGLSRKAQCLLAVRVAGGNDNECVIN